MAKSTTLYINLGSGLGGAIAPVKYGWRVTGDTLSGKSIRAALGIKVAKEAEKGIVYGANNPKPARVRINFEGGGSTSSFCDPSKLEGVTYGGALNKKTWDIEGKFKNRKISTVTSIQG